MAKLISPADAVKLLKKEEIFLLDVRTPQEFSDGHIENAVNIPLDYLMYHLDELPENSPILTYCLHGKRCQVAGQFLNEQGFEKILILDGGMTAFQKALKE